MSSLGSALNAGIGGRLKLVLCWKNQNMAFRSEITQILSNVNKVQYWIELISSNKKTFQCLEYAHGSFNNRNNLINNIINLKIKR